MEAKYIKKSTDNSVAQTKKKCDMSETELRNQIDVCRISNFYELKILNLNENFTSKKA